MLKSCWSKKSSVEEFSEQFFSDSVSESERESIIDDLFAFCGEETYPSLLFIEYLEEIFEKEPKKIIEYYINPDKKHITALLRLIIQNKGACFKKLPFFEEYAVDFALRVLSICIDENSTQSILILSEIMNFDVLIAKGKLLFNDRVNELTEKFPESKCIEILGPIVPYPRTLLQNALYSKDVSKPFLFTCHQLIRVLLPCISMIGCMPRIFNFTEKKTFYHLYYHLLSDYLLRPRLLSGYLLTNIFPRIELSSGDIEKFENIELSNENVIKLLDECCAEFNNESILTSHSPRQSCDYMLNTEQIETIKTLLTHLPEKMETENIVEQCYQYPAQINFIYGHIEEVMNEFNTKSASQYADKILENLDDFITLLFQQNHFYDIINVFIRKVCEVTDKKEFSYSWNLLITLFRYAWGIGWEKLNNQLLAYVDSLDNAAMRYSLRVLVHREPKDEELPTYQSTPFVEIVNLHYNLCHGTADLISAIKELDSKPYLSTPILLYCLSHPSIEMRDIWVKNPEDTPLNNLFFYHLMVLISPNPNAWITGTELPDYEFLLREAPKDISLINPILSDCFDKLLGTELTTMQMWDIICIWVAWAKSFGILAFIKQLFEQLIWKAKHVGVLTDVESIFQNVSYLILVISTQNPKMVREIVENIELIINEDVKENVYSDATAHFIAILICGTEELWEENVKLLVEKCRIFIRERDKNESRAKFALSALRICICNKHLSRLLDLSIEEDLYSVHDWQTLIDFYTSKATNQ